MGSLLIIFLTIDEGKREQKEGRNEGRKERIYGGYGQMRTCTTDYGQLFEHEVI